MTGQPHLKRRTHVRVCKSLLDIEGTINALHIDNTITIDIHSGEWMGKQIRLPRDAFEAVAFERDRARNKKKD